MEHVQIVERKIQLHRIGKNKRYSKNFFKFVCTKERYFVQTKYLSFVFLYYLFIA